MKITQLHAVTVRIPQKPPIAPYQSRYRATSEKEALLIRLETDTGLVGWGETPVDWLGKSFEGTPEDLLRQAVLGRDPFDLESFYAENRLGSYLASGVEMAMWDLMGKATGRPVYQLLGGAVRKTVELAACMGIRPYHEAKEIARHYLAMGFSTLKTKAGRRAEEDLEMVRGIRDGVGDRLKLRIDPNQGYPPEVAFPLARDLEPYHLEYFEQPMPLGLIADAARLRRQTRTPIALNESVTTLEIVLQIIQLGAADVLLPDTYQCGGILGVKKVAALAEAAGLPCVFHCAHDLGLKTAAMLHVVASTPNFPLANDCTYYGLVDDIITPMHRIEAGRMAVPEGPGLGVAVDEAKVRQYQV
ncbi:MAG: mandelate racemase/muconate lactonizing enzyme family protein [Gemmataceae bacterium]|nr:mandelate racemase/muconate lactonizing enzyme family protein [Gemmataceae bacterium]MDW8267191.1 mandelate racemase/muconate lactonizing enzyme family protein [Gemmataceae bacterium]